MKKESVRFMKFWIYIFLISFIELIFWVLLSGIYNQKNLQPVPVIPFSILGMVLRFLYVKNLLIFMAVTNLNKLLPKK